VVYYECLALTVSLKIISLAVKYEADTIDSIITGMAATLSFGLGLRDASLIILFFGILCTIPPAYLSTLGPKTGLRQMVQARYSFG
jgi:purine-cytosine permease-like protein